MNYTGKKIGIVGLGKIGFRTAQCLKDLYKCEIYYFSRRDKHIPNFNYITLEKIFTECDYVIFTVKANNFFVPKDLLFKANKNLVIVNISRDTILPLTDVVPLLETGMIRGFIGDLDIIGLEKNSFPANVLITSHFGYLTQEAAEMKNNMLAYFLKKYMLENSNNIYIIRHGETEWNTSNIFQGNLDSILTDNGIKNAEDIAYHLSGKGIKYIFSSPLNRAKRTAEIIAEKLNAEVIIIPEFKEINFGIFEGKKKKPIMKLFSNYFINRNNNPYYKMYIRYPNGESYFDVYLRVMKPLLFILANYDNFAIVGHESLNKILRGIISQFSYMEMLSLRQKNNEIVVVDTSQDIESIFQI